MSVTNLDGELRSAPMQLVDRGAAIVLAKLS